MIIRTNAKILWVFDHTQIDYDDLIITRLLFFSYFIRSKFSTLKRCLLDIYLLILTTDYM